MAKIEIKSKGYFQSIDEFVLMHDIGVGSFGKVKLALHRGTRRHYAIKIIDLTQGLTPTEVSLVLREIKVHYKLDHPHIIKLWDTLTDNQRIYMVMDYAQNGSLFNYQSKLLKEGRQPPNQQIYQFFYQTLQAVKYLHSVDIMHRDIKPQNLLLDENLNVKLCDFGWATNQISTPRFTFCGTYEYMAPEMALEKSYNFNIDIWALGVLLFELVHGRAPFQADTLRAMKERISIGSYQINGQCHEEIKNLIMDILQFVPEKRLSIAQIESHQWILSSQKEYSDDSCSKTVTVGKPKRQHAQPHLLAKNKSLEHQHVKSKESLLYPSQQRGLAKENPDSSDFLLSYGPQDVSQFSSNQVLRFKKHRRNVTQPIDISQYDKGGADRYDKILFGALQTEANTPWPIDYESGKKVNKLMKSNKKCKTQGEDQILQLFGEMKPAPDYGQLNNQGKKRSHLRTETGPIVCESSASHSRNFSSSLLKENNLCDLECRQATKRKPEASEKTKKKIQRIEDKLHEISSRLSPSKPKCLQMSIG